MRKDAFPLRVFAFVLVLPLALASCSIEQGTSATSVKHTILRQWKPNGAPNGFGAEILLEEDLSKEEIISFVRSFASDRDPVSINIYTSRIAYDQERTNNFVGDEYAKGFLLVYVKNFTGQGAYRGLNEIRWMQEIGKFSDLFGEKTQL
jgi:hypothetical protein